MVYKISLGAISGTIKCISRKSPLPVWEKIVPNDTNTISRVKGASLIKNVVTANFLLSGFLLYIKSEQYNFVTLYHLYILLQTYQTFPLALAGWFCLQD